MTYILLRNLGISHKHVHWQSSLLNIFSLFQAYIAKEVDEAAYCPFRELKAFRQTLHYDKMELSQLIQTLWADAIDLPT